MKNKELFTIFGAINNLSNIKSVKFAYCLSKNKKTISDEIKHIQDSVEKLDEVNSKIEKEFEDKRIALVTEYADKDSNDQPIIENNNYKITNISEFNEKFAELKKEYPEFLKKRQDITDNNNKLLDEESELEFHKIKVDNLPDELSLNDLDLISEFIEE